MKLFLFWIKYWVRHQSSALVRAERFRLKFRAISGSQLLQNTWIIKQTVVLLWKNVENMDLSRIHLAVRDPQSIWCKLFTLSWLYHGQRIDNLMVIQLIYIFFNVSKAIQQFVWLFTCFVRVVNMKLFAGQFHVSKSYKTHESTLLCIGNFEENINLSHIPNQKLQRFLPWKFIRG